jgi:hypothetical protein
MLQIQLSNIGNIDASFSLMPSQSHYASSFTFVPASGTLGPGAVVSIAVTFRASAIGELDEDFGFAIDDVPGPVRLVVRGRVVGPRLRFDADSIDFGVVPFGFVTSRSIVLVNESEVPVAFALRLPHESDAARDVSIEPALGSVPPNGSITVSVDLLPSLLQKYHSMRLLTAASSPALSSTSRLPAAIFCRCPCLPRSWCPTCRSAPPSSTLVAALLATRMLRYAHSFCHVSDL